MNFLLQGWLLGIAYVAPIGMQNMYLINTALEEKRSRTLQVALIIIFFDISLALACFFGIGLVLEHFAFLKFIVMGVGSLAVMYIGYSLIKADPSPESNHSAEQTMLKVAFTCFAVTWLNPQAIIDGTLLLGGFRATLESSQSILFIAGVALASASWFLGLSTLIGTFRKAFNTRILKIINILCGSILILFGLKLAISFVRSII